MSESKKVSIVLAGRTYPMIANEVEEASLRILERKVNDWINNFQIQYKHIDKQDCLAMALINLSLEEGTPSSAEADKAVETRIGQIENLFDSHS